jgi:uncharacterized cupredoxin-like copper-binding protein
MIMRLWILASIVLVALAWVLMVPLTPPPSQASPPSTIDANRLAGVVPKTGEMMFSDAVGHDVFEIPATDAAHAAEEAAAGGMADMPGMATGTPATPAETPTGGDAGHGAEVGVAGTMPGMPGMAEGGSMTEMPAMGSDTGAHEAGQAGLQVVDGMMAHMAARTVEIEMREWSFSPANITVAAGEVVRLVVRNTGNVPHEFMLMPPQGMAAVAYRLERADWSLTEHEAIFEREAVLPGDSFEVVVQAQQAGNWMYMCMFPYHMQFGMMGQLATEGAAAPMGGMDMGGMKM